MRGMNKLAPAKRAQILQMLCEGSSMRSISRTADVSINTVAKLLVDAGKACAAFHDEKVRGVKASRVQCDEIWSFTYAKQKNVKAAKAAPEEAGDTWTWTALDADTKLIVSWLVGGRDAEYANAFMNDLASRLANRVQLTTDGHKAYLEAVEGAFGADVDYATAREALRRKPRGAEALQPGRVRRLPQRGDHRPPREEAREHELRGAPEPHDADAHAAVHPAHQRLLEEVREPLHMVAIYTVWYNFVRIHKTLKVTPAMAAGLSPILWSMEDVAALIDAAAPKPGKRGPYKKRAV